MPSDFLTPFLELDEEFCKVRAMNGKLKQLAACSVVSLDACLERQCGVVHRLTAALTVFF